MNFTMMLIEMAQFALIILNTEIREFLLTTQYQTLAELQSHARRREIELDMQGKEKRQSQFRPCQQRSGSSPLILDLQARKETFTTSTGRRMRFFVGQGPGAINIAMRAIMQGISNNN